MADEKKKEGGDERQPKSFVDFASQFVDADPRVQALKAVEDPDAGQTAELRYMAMEVERSIQMAQDDYKRLNPDASEVEVQDMIEALYARDVATVDKIMKQVDRKRREKEESESEGKSKRVALNQDDSAGEEGENRFTGQNTRSGIRRILFGNS